ncbi:MAG: hypothetical protein KC468_31050, partial [Myxococcales bacterium]|nr:hypothetical protein [Myxococcales bacterium]
LLDALGEPSGRTVIDNIVSTRQQGGAAQGLENPVLMPRAPGGSDLSLSESFARLIDHGYDWQDLSQFFLRVLRYMATSSKRRAAELEEMSWWQFLCGWDPDTQTARFRYSERFAHDVKFSTKVLVAFNADWGDARTNGSTYIQLFLNSLVQRERVDGCLNGPTSRAWFEPWRAHLELLGVEFVQGTLATLRVDEHGRVLPYTRSARDSAPRPDLEADYYVVATDVVTAEAVTRELPQRGVPATLDGYTTRVDPNPRKATGESTTRDPHARVGVAPWDRLQTLTGIQYYFTTDFKLVHGHMYFADAPWALSSISQQQFWRDRPLLHRDGYCAVLSVDVGAFDRPATDPALGGRTAWDMTRDELAEEVWRQICASLGERLDQPKDADAPRRHDVINPTLRFPQPAWFHMDEFIEYGLADESGDERPLRNHAPFLIPIAGDWKRRPGGDPWSPRAGDRELAARPEHREIWQAPHGGYWVHWNRLVFAGTYKKTFTRMTTMESANESARHAVNAILDHFLLSPAARRRRQQHLGAAAVADEPRLRLVEPELDAQSDETSGATARPWRPAAPDEAGHDAPYRSSLLGDYCQIWDIEDYELPEFKPLRRYDEELFDQGMPHPWDLAGVEVMPAVFSKMPRVEGSSFAALRALLTSVRQRLESSAKESWRSGSIEDGIELLEAIRKTVESELERTFAGFERARRRGRGDESENA